MNHESFKTWFVPTSLLSQEGSTLRVKVPDRVFEDHIRWNYQDKVEESLEEVGIGGYSIVYESSLESSHQLNETQPAIKQESSKTQSASAAAATPRRQYFSTTSVYSSKSSSGKLSDDDLNEIRLNPKYTFDTFIVGDSNRFAHAGALAVANDPVKSYNPLFIYGGAGLGKTHLLNAIGHRIKEQHPHLRVCCKSLDQFMNEMTGAMTYNNIMAFRDRYRHTVDILLIDDIQDIAGKEGTQKMFFHTFNALYENQKQIVISADCPPKEIPDLEERLHTRFEWGLIADITPPDLETKIAILHKKANLLKINLPDDVAIFIAKKIKSNIRQLEGSLIRLVTKASLGYPINLELAKEAIAPIIVEDAPSVTMEKIQKVVAKHYNLKVSDLKSKSRKKEIILPRHVAMYLCRRLVNSSFPEIGGEFGKDHSTVISAVEKIEKQVEEKKDNIHIVINRLIASCE